MKRLFLIVLAIGAIIVFLFDNLPAQSKQSYAYKDFNGIEAGSQISVYVIQADEYSIEAEGNETDISQLKVIKKGKTLVFYYEQPGYVPNDKIIVNIKTPELYNVNLSSGSGCNIKMNLESDDFMAKLSGGSTLTGDLSCEDADFICSGRSSVTLNGKAEILTVKGSDECIMNLKDFYVEDVNADLSQSSSLIITSYGTLNTNQKDSSGIVYYGNPVIYKSDFSSASVIARGE